jgi:hypothetical protein
MTKKMEALFKSHPPRRPLTSLQAIVDDWNDRFGKDGPERHRRDMVVDYCIASNSLDEAIKRACASRAANGKCHNHQSRVKEADRQWFADRIADFLVCVGKKPRNFDELHDLLEVIAPDGVGPVTIYDVATRIGAYLKLEPTSLYLHAGVRVGWERLHGRCAPATKRIPIKSLPKELHQLDADSLEDFFCTYREYFHPRMISAET